MLTYTNALVQLCREYCYEKGVGEEQHDVVKSRILLLLDAVRAVPQVLAPMRSSCEYLTLIGAPDISVAILMLRKGCRIPCHSHPEMTVFTKILKGMALVHTYKILPADKTMAMPGVVATDIMVEKISTIADTQSPPSIIDTDGPNFHSFVAIEDTWIYDITCPPYKAADEHEIYYSDASERDIYTTQEISNSDSTMGLCILLDMADPKSAGTATHYPTSNDSCIPLNKSIITWISHDSDSSFQPRPQAFMQYANQHVQKSRNHKPSKGNLALDK